VDDSPSSSRNLGLRDASGEWEAGETSSRPDLPPPASERRRVDPRADLSLSWGETDRRLAPRLRRSSVTLLCVRTQCRTATVPRVGHRDCHIIDSHSSPSETSGSTGLRRGGSVTADCHHEEDAGSDQPLLSERGQTGRLSSEVVPPHGFQPARLQSPPLSWGEAELPHSSADELLHQALREGLVDGELQ
jgi:hypothetical protein